MSRIIKANKNQKLKTKQIYEKGGKAAPSSKWSGASFFRAPRTQCTEAEE